MGVFAGSRSVLATWKIDNVSVQRHCKTGRKLCFGFDCFLFKEEATSIINFPDNAKVGGSSLKVSMEKYHRARDLGANLSSFRPQALSRKVLNLSYQIWQRSSFSRFLLSLPDETLWLGNQKDIV